MARKVDIQEQTSTTLVMESAFSDVYTLAIPISLISLYTGASFSLGSMFGHIFTSLVLAVVAGVGTGYLWSILLTKVPTLLKTRFSTPAFVFIVYGLVELLNFSGPIAVLFFSITLGNVTLLRPRLLSSFLPTHHIELTSVEKDFFSEMVFLLRTFFFVYVGMSIVLNNAYLIGLGAAITVLLFLVRIPVVLASADTKAPLFDMSFMSIMIPKGLGRPCWLRCPPSGVCLAAPPFKPSLSPSLFSRPFFVQCYSFCWKNASCWVSIGFSLAPTAPSMPLLPQCRPPSLPPLPQCRPPSLPPLPGAPK